ncbi:Transcriptional regulator, GntR family domain / Aspartate aminotransferase [hydrothermal vent metagenome]|uniref:Transcriptional regulator, GntR family domain / Aspartate aminotransferase n=1 Tax=hydrothermal vent metagenome TaxID=652676 RepID=A0A1W1EBD3_9ZZZZ
MKRSFIREILEHTNSETISFAGGLPDASLFPNKALRKSACRVLKQTNVLQYGTSTGYEPLKEKIAEMYTKDGFETTSDNILITSGSQQALDIISRFHSSKKITIESPSYLGAMNIFSLNNLMQDSVMMKKSGLDIKAFHDSFKSTKLAYLIPDFQNPTGITYSLKKREKIANIIQKHDGLIIEDSPYSKLYFKKEYKSISSMIPNHSYHLGSFSKTLAPALRIGWIRASKELIQPLVAYKEAMDLHTNGLVQSLLNDYLSNQNHYDMHMKLLRKKYNKKMQFFSKTLDKELPEFVYKKPKGGMFIYGEFLNINTSLLVQECLKKGVVFVPGIEFYTDNKNRNQIRFNFTNSSKKDVEIGLNIIRKVIEKRVKTKLYV